jgi:hypothetical protein
MAETLGSYIANTQWAFAAAETALLIESLSQKFSCELKEYMNQAGEVAGVITHKKKMDLSVSGRYLTTFTGAVGVAVTLVTGNIISAHGVAAGLLICKAINLDNKNDDLMGISLEATRYALVTS